ncbi:type II CAAX prenyl endopeptidase Rce1 family protein [Stackebrandtia soli]|uniref:CPBP family glutamic-type intramembrane protease n=1 Tax=Stackebrandtia soli TaxID=1892856 RepID=UPI0039EC3ADF
MNEQVANRRPGIALRAMLTWVFLLAALTVGGALWLNVEGGSHRDLSPAVLVIAYAPTIAALVAVSFVRGGVRALLARLLHWKAGARWYAIALLGPLLLVLAATALFVALGRTAPTNWLVLPSLAMVPTLLGPVIAGCLGEELGWRGFAQPQLQRRFAALVAAIVIGVIWSLWHLWPILTPVGFAELSMADIVQTFVRLVSTAVIYAWLYNGTGGALPVVLVAHAAHNVAINLMPTQVIGTDTVAWAVAFLYAAAAAAVVLLTSSRTLTRQAPIDDPVRPGRSESTLGAGL